MLPQGSLTENALKSVSWIQLENLDTLDRHLTIFCSNNTQNTKLHGKAWQHVGLFAVSY